MADRYTVHVGTFCTPENSPAVQMNNFNGLRETTGGGTPAVHSGIDQFPYRIMKLDITVQPVQTVHCTRRVPVHAVHTPIGVYRCTAVPA